MHFVVIAIGSTTCPVAHIHWASQRLTLLLTDMRLSKMIWTKDVKGTDLMYMNRLVSGKTSLSAEILEYELKIIESMANRTKEQITIDLDLMQHDNLRYHIQDWPRPYIQQLLPDIL